MKRTNEKCPFNTSVVLPCRKEALYYRPDPSHLLNCFMGHMGDSAQDLPRISLWICKIDISLGGGLQSLMCDGSFIALPVRSVDRNTLKRQNNKGVQFCTG